uniref:PX domain-containing protein n=1 Tax=Kalmanozyma brasiliensis (strain GHG001) TaxID=1365824 RepID=V5EPV7_KALBG
MKVLITGASGLLGRAVHQQCIDKGYDIRALAFTRSDPEKQLVKLDLTDVTAVESCLSDFEPDVIVHTAAERRPDVVENDPAASQAINVDAPASIATIASMLDKVPLLINISTDYVFDGSKPPYKVEDAPNPLNAYGVSKLQGERAVAEHAKPGHFTNLRVPVLYGRTITNDESAVNVLLNAIQPPAGSTNPKKCDAYAVRYPTNVADVAKAILKLAEVYAETRNAAPPTTHFSAKEAMTKYDMCMVLSRVANAVGFETRTDLLDPEYEVDPMAATARPRHCKLDTSVLEEYGVPIEYTSFEDWWRPYLAELHQAKVEEDARLAAEAEAKRQMEEEERKKREAEEDAERQRQLEEERRIAAEKAEAEAQAEAQRQAEEQARQQKEAEEAANKPPVEAPSEAPTNGTQPRLYHRPSFDNLQNDRDRAAYIRLHTRAHNFTIRVGDPQRIGDPMTAHIVYTVRTTTDHPSFRAASFSSLRRYRDFRWLHAALVQNNPGIIVPPVPEKVSIGRFAAELVEARRMGLETCVNKIASHPLLQLDEDFRLFLESENFAADVKARDAVKGPIITPEQKTYKSWGSALLGSVVPSSSSLSSGFLSAASFVEVDPWFDDQRMYLDSLESSLKGMVKSISSLSAQRKSLVTATHDLAQVLTTLSGSSLSRSLSTCFAGLAEVQTRAMQLDDLQAEADVRSLGTTMYEYERVVGSIRKTFVVRTEVWARSARAADELRRTRGRFDKYKATNPSAAGAQFQSLLSEVTEAEGRALEAERLFGTVSERCKDEMERLDLERVLDFKRVVGEWETDGQNVPTQTVDAVREEEAKPADADTTKDTAAAPAEGEAPSKAVEETPSTTTAAAPAEPAVSAKATGFAQAAQPNGAASQTEAPLAKEETVPPPTSASDAIGADGTTPAQALEPESAPAKADP